MPNDRLRYSRAVLWGLAVSTVTFFVGGEYGQSCTNSVPCVSGLIGYFAAAPLIFAAIVALINWRRGVKARRQGAG